VGKGGGGLGRPVEARKRRARRWYAIGGAGEENGGTWDDSRKQKAKWVGPNVIVVGGGGI
jgi:hypothetical protein